MIVQAYLTAPSLNGLAPSEVMYMPAGRSTIEAKVGGESKAIDVNVTERTAAILQRDLEKLLAKHVQPFIDFDHEGKASAANPKGFRWVTGKGVYLALEWTKGGRERVEGKDYRYFSPTFHVGPDGEPNGLPESGAIGALTNNPAFRDIQRIAASRTKAAANGDDDGATKPNKPLNQVSQEIKDNLAKLGLISKDDARIEDPVRRMAEQKRVIAHFRSTHPDMRTEEVFRQLTRLNPKFFKD